MRSRVSLRLAAGVILGYGLSVAALNADAATANDDSAAYPAYSAPNDILISNNEIGLALKVSKVDYLEKEGSTKLDSEKGWLPGFDLSVSTMGHHLGVDNLYLYGQLSWRGGNTDYVGSYWGGTYGDLRQRDGNDIVNEDFRIGKGFLLSDRFMLTPYLGIGARQWGRSINGSGGYHEDYEHSYAGGGLMMQFATASHWVISINGLVGSTFDANMDSSRTAGSPAMTPQPYDLGSEQIQMAGISVDFPLTKTVHANLGVDYTHFKYGSSSVSPIDFTLEPDSRTSEVTFNFGVGIPF